MKKPKNNNHKIAIISDLHYGIKSDNPAFLDSNKLFFDNVLFPTLKSENVSVVIQMGDVFDRRKYINYVTASRTREDFLEPINKLNIPVKMIVGNHDVFYKSTNENNSFKELIDGRYKNIETFYDCHEFEIDNIKILLIPWISPENRERSLNSIEQSLASICFGHLELKGFEMIKGSINDHGDPIELFEKFTSVYSGHYHHPSTRGNVFYLGANGEFNWGDSGGDRGFHILDSGSLKTTFYPNPYKMFVKIFYDDIKTPVDEIMNTDFKYYQGKFVKLIVRNCVNTECYELFYAALEAANPSDIQIVQESIKMELDDKAMNEEEINAAETTMDIFSKYIETVSTNVDRKQLKKTMDEIYNKAVSEMTNI